MDKTIAAVFPSMAHAADAVTTLIQRFNVEADSVEYILQDSHLTGAHTVPPAMMQITAVHQRPLDIRDSGLVQALHNIGIRGTDIESYIAALKRGAVVASVIVEDADEAIALFIDNGAREMTVIETDELI